MAFDGNGNWISTFSAVADRDAGIKILASRFDNIFINDIAQSFENCLTKDGQVKTQVNFDVNNNRLINVVDPINDYDGANKAYVDYCIAHVEQDQLFAFKWADYIINDQNWLRADTFSWQDGTVYTNAYSHLVADIDGIIPTTETVGSYTITYYPCEDGHKVVAANQESMVQSIYNESGVAWYYILDTANQRFKLPRTKYGFTGLRDTVGKYVPESLPNIKGSGYDAIGPGNDTTYANGTTEGAFYCGNQKSAWRARWYGTEVLDQNALSLDASRSSSTYQDNAPVQQRATQMYLYFYVGQFTQTATEQTAGLNSELFNGKVDLNLANIDNANNVAANNLNTKGIRTVVDSYESPAGDEYYWYRIWSDGWVEQGGLIHRPAGGLITYYYPVQLIQTKTFNGMVSSGFSGTLTSTHLVTIDGVYDDSFEKYMDSNFPYFWWEAKGYKQGA